MFGFDSHHPLQIDPEVRNALSFKRFFSKWFPNGSLPKEPFEEPFFMPKPYLLARPSGLYVRFTPVTITCRQNVV